MARSLYDVSSQQSPALGSNRLPSSTHNVVINDSGGTLMRHDRWVSAWGVATTRFALTGLATLSLAVEATGAQRAAGAAPRVEVAPNIMVSNDGDVTHIEPHLAT